MLSPDISDLALTNLSIAVCIVVGKLKLELGDLLVSQLIHPFVRGYPEVDAIGAAEILDCVIALLVPPLDGALGHLHVQVQSIAFLKEVYRLSLVEPEGGAEEVWSVRDC